MATLNTISASSVTGHATPSTTTLESLSARLRDAGLFLVMLRPDATVAWHDSRAAMFFQRFVLPLIHHSQTSNAKLAAEVAALAGVGDAAARWDFVPGVVLAAVPVFEKRQFLGALVVAAKSQSHESQRRFHDDEDVARVCSRLGIDGTWLDQQARQVPGFLPTSLTTFARLVAASVADEMRIAGLGQELDAMSSQLAGTYEELSLIYQISSGMKLTRGPGEFFKQACLDVMEVINTAGMGVALCGEAGSTWRQEPVLYGQMALPPGQVQRLAEQVMGLLKKQTTPLLVNDLLADKTLAWASAFARQLIAVPLQRQDQVLGCLFGLDKQEGEFDSVDTKLLNSIANQSAIYLENTRLYEDVHDLMMGLLHSLTSAVDAKDPYTCGHSERVALLGRWLAQQAGVPPEQIERIYMAGILHDVGKIGVPEAVLQKAGRLTPEEFDQMKRHPQIGAHILSDIKQVQDLIPGVLYHHERYDGKGYPAGLVGQDIPVMGRLLCVADSFDAMTSNRTYRTAMPLEVALMEIRRCAGTQFDPILAEKFLQINAEDLRALLRDHQPVPVQPLTPQTPSGAGGST